MTYIVYIHIRMFFAVLVMVFATIIVGLGVLVVSMFSSGFAAYRLIHWWGRTVSAAMGITASLRGGSNVISETSYIVAPNHQSVADILSLLLVLPLRYRWVVKKELIQIPFFGWGLAKSGAISVDRSNREKAVKSVAGAAKKLSGGWSVIVYPEGTTTWDGSLSPFKKGPFKLAVETGTPILPVTINGAYKILPRGKWVVRPGHVVVTIGEPIITNSLGEEDVPDLMDRTRVAIGKFLDQEYDPFAAKTT